jgi:hypothetical protein
LFWGLVQYTKNNPNTYLAAPSAAISQPAHQQIPHTKDNPSTPIATPNNISSQSINVQLPVQNQESSTPSVSLPSVPDGLGAIHGITEKNFNRTLQSLRTKRHLRALEALESGQSVAETARGTYFFVSVFFLEASSGKMVEQLRTRKVSRFRDNDFYFEIHLPNTGAPIIMGLTNESDAVRLDSPNREIRRISLAAVPWEKMTSLVSLPSDHIITSNNRSISLKERERIEVLDIEIR